MSTSAPEQPAATGQDQQTQTPDPTTAAAAPPVAPPPAAPAAPSPAPGPWSADLAQMFQDEATRGQVDQYLRNTIQPRMTQLEQQASDAKDAMGLWTAFDADPVQAYVQVTRELFGDDAATAIETQLQQEQQQTPPPADGQGQGPADPRLEEMYQAYQNNQVAQQYDTELTRIKEAHPEVVENWFHKYVAAADGNFDEAYRVYTEEMADIATKLGVTSLTDAQQAAAEPPQVLGSDTGTTPPSSTPVAPRKQTLHEAIEDFARELNTSPAPPVGNA